MTALAPLLQEEECHVLVHFPVSTSAADAVVAVA